MKGLESISKALVFSVLAAIVFISPSDAFAISCGDTLTGPAGKVHTLTGNLICSQSPALKVKGHGQILNLNGFTVECSAHVCTTGEASAEGMLTMAEEIELMVEDAEQDGITIDEATAISEKVKELTGEAEVMADGMAGMQSVGGGIGIKVFNRFNTVKNGRVRFCDIGVLFENGGDHKAFGIRAEFNNIGIDFHNSHNNWAGNNSTFNNDFGTFVNGPANKVEKTNSDTESFGIVVLKGSNTIKKNIVMNTAFGIFDLSENSRYEGNKVENSSFAYLGAGSKAFVSGNSASSSLFGFVDDGTDNIYKGNWASGNSRGTLLA